jgi:hypothetical protein
MGTVVELRRMGNRLAQTVTKGYAPAASLSVDAATNRISAASNWL